MREPSDFYSFGPSTDFRLPSNNNRTLKIRKLHNDVQLPVYSSLEASGADLFAYLPGGEPDAWIDLGAGDTAIIPTGLSFEIDPGYEIQIRSRSGMAAKASVLVLNSPGTIDSDYRGEVKIILHNSSQDKYGSFIVKHGDRIAQMVLAPVLRAAFWDISSLPALPTTRGEGGFGSTGK